MKKKFMTLPFSIKEVDESEGEGIVKGYASAFGNMDYGFDIIEKGAFKKTLKESGGKIPILADHDPRKQIGYNLVAKEDDKGLYVEGKLDIKNNQLAKERYSLAKMALDVGAKFGFSIGYFTIKEEPDDKNPRIRRLKELKLLEYSTVTFPMNIEAQLTGAKSIYSVLNDSDYAEVIANLLNLGKTKEEIIETLEKAVNPVVDPNEKDIQSVIENMNKIKNILS